MRHRWILPLFAVLAVVLVGATSRASKQCAYAKCHSPEHCTLRKYRAQQMAMAAVFGSPKLRGKYSDEGAFVNAAAKAAGAVNAKLPGCKGAGADIALGGDVGAETGKAEGYCNTVFNTGGGKIHVEDVDNMGNKRTNPKVYDLNTCTEILDSALLHEGSHMSNCIDASKSGQPYPPQTMGAYLDDDAAAYRVAANYLRKQLKDARRLRCSGDTKFNKQFTTSMFAAMGAKR